MRDNKRERDFYSPKQIYNTSIIDNYIWQASRRDNPSSWLPVATITVRLKVYKEKKRVKK